jgi:hypothetical protein
VWGGRGPIVAAASMIVVVDDSLFLPFRFLRKAETGAFKLEQQSNSNCPTCDQIQP